MYLYQTPLYKEGVAVIGIDPDNATNRADFEDNYKDLATPIGELFIAETTAITEFSYAQFKDELDEHSIPWSSVQYAENSRQYMLYFLWDQPT